MIDVVALVASAGGLKALSVVLGDLPRPFPVAVIVQQHLGGRSSVLVSILRRRSEREVVWAKDGEIVAPGRVTVCPPQMRMEVLPDGTCCLTPGRSTVVDRPHDVLLTLLAESHGSGALAAVLTGMGRDGSGGVAALRAAGATVLAQSEETAEQPSMPRAAVRAGASRVVPLHQIGRVIGELVRGEPQPPSCSGWAPVTREIPLPPGERRLATLRDIARATTGASSAGEVCERVARALAAYPEDVPFALLYLNGTFSQRVNLAASTGIEAGAEAAPHLIDLRAGHPVWPMGQMLADDVEIRVVDDLAARLPGLVAGPGPQTPSAAVMLALRPVAQEPPVGVLIVGLSARIRFDEGYRGFVELIARQVAASIGEARTRERERGLQRRLAEFDRAKGEFYSLLGREFRVPLTATIESLAQTLRRSDELPRALAAEVESAHRRAGELLRLVGCLLDLSQLETDRLRVRPVPTDLASLTVEVAAQFRDVAGAAGLRLGIDAPPLPDPVWVDPLMWETIVSHLVANALKFTWEGAIDVSLRALPKHAVLVVRDTGVGIPSDELPFVFNRFHRASGVRGRTTQGAGIGLALVNELVRRHFGRVWVRSERGAGSTFTIWVPLGRRPGQRGPVRKPRRWPSAGAVAAALAAEASRWEVAEPARRDGEAPVGRRRGRACRSDGDPVPERVARRLRAPALPAGVERSAAGNAGSLRDHERRRGGVDG
jgi:signal transduction histidine kinase